MSIPEYAMPDYMAAIKLHLEAQPYISSNGFSVKHLIELQEEDTGSDPDVRTFKRNIITLQGIPGFGQHTGLIMNPRFEVRSWGTNGYMSMLGWRLAHTALCPPPGDPVRFGSFTYAKCHVYDVAIVSTPIVLPDPSGWQSRSAFYSAKVREVPVS